MALHPFREALGQAGLRAFQHESSFKAVADTALARFQTLRDDLERQVRRGDLTVKVARERARSAAAELKTGLSEQAEGYSPVPRVFLDRLVEACDLRKKAREYQSLEGLQRETNRLLRQTLVEQQLRTRAEEFEGRTFVRSMPGGKPAPTLDSLLAFHETATQAGDEAAREWARRQLEAMRPRVPDAADQRRIDRACDRPDSVNPRTVATYLEALPEADPAALEVFVTEALAGRDSNACVAAFVMAREAPGGTGLRWVRDVLNGLNEFPDAALTTLRALEAEARASDADSARAQADYAVALAEAQDRFPGLEAPTDEELERQARLQSKPVARLGEAIGLALDRRGLDRDDLQGALCPAPDFETGAE
jgi:hypothetical protein